LKNNDMNVMRNQPRTMRPFINKTMKLTKHKN
jgi:hypothetical protein